MGVTEGLIVLAAVVALIVIVALVVARSGRSGDGGSEELSTEELHQAIRQYRAVYERLVGR